MRTFVAIELDDSCRTSLADAAAAMQALGGHLRWQRPDTMHLTLKFIGDIADSDLPVAADALSGVGERCSPFDMEVAGVSGFPPSGVPRVVHVGVNEDTGALADLQARVDEAIESAIGLARERRRYVPHVTLGRARDRRCPTVAQLAAAVPDDSFGLIHVTSFVLFMSELRPEGARHTALQEFELQCTA